jgi:phosphoribosylformylglycinamidine synthase subunit PurS
MKARVTVMPKKSVLDPQGVAVRNAIATQGFPQVQSVRIGKLMEIEIDDEGLDAKAAQAQLHQICNDLLSNPVIEDYVLEIEG